MSIQVQSPHIVQHFIVIVLAAENIHMRVGTINYDCRVTSPCTWLSVTGGDAMPLTCLEIEAVCNVGAVSIDETTENIHKILMHDSSVLVALRRHIIIETLVGLSADWFPQVSRQIE